MNYIPVCLIIFLGCVQALGSDDSSEESADFSDLLSSEEDSKDIILADTKDGSSSEENSKEIYGQKIDIEEALKTILFSDDASDDVSEKNPEKNNLNENVDTPDSEKKANANDLKDSQEVIKQFSENREENEKVKEVNQENSENYEMSKESDPEPGNIIGSYVLWRPYVLDYTGILQAEKNYYKSVAYIKEFLEGGFDIEEDEEKEKMGWKDDAQQLDLPRVAALTSNNEPDLYDNIADSFNNLKETVNEVVSRPEVKDNMFYILMGLTGFLMLALFNDNIFKKQETRTVQDHYLLPDSGASAKLPTYEECVKADKNILVNIGDNETFNKVDLSLPVFVVDTEKEGQRRTNRE